ncbi:hypothetical protein EMIT0357P_100034 [Pseudomonas marginalis]
MLCRMSAYLISSAWPLRTRTGDRAPSRYSHTGRENSGWLRSARITAISGVTLANAVSKTSAVMPACRACARKPACHSAKVWVGWMSRLSTASGATTAGATTGAVWSFGKGWASAAVGFSAQATSRMRLEAAINWRRCQRRERQEGMHRSRNYKSGTDLIMPEGRLPSGSQKVRSLPAIRLEGFAAVAAFALAGAFLTAAEQWLGDDGFGLVGAMLGWLFAHGRCS